MSPNSPGGWGPPPGPQGPWGPPPQGPPGGPPGGAPPWGAPPAGYGPTYGAPGGGYGPQPYGGNPYGPPASPGFAYQSSSDTATWALILAIVSWFSCFCLLSIPAIFMARSELAAIDRGESSPINRGNAQAAFWIAAINVGLSILALAAYALIMIFAVGASASHR